MEMAFRGEEMAHAEGGRKDGACLMLRNQEACEVAGLSC